MQQTITNLMYQKFEFAVMVTKFLQEKQIILVVVLIFGLVCWTIVIFSVLLDHTAQLQHVKFLVIVGIDLSHSSFCLQNSIITQCYFSRRLSQPNSFWLLNVLTRYAFPIADITAGWVQLIKIVSFNFFF